MIQKWTNFFSKIDHFFLSFYFVFILFMIMRPPFFFVISNHKREWGSFEGWALFMQSTVSHYHGHNHYVGDDDNWSWEAGYFHHFRFTFFLTGTLSFLLPSPNLINAFFRFVLAPLKEGMSVSMYEWLSVCPYVDSTIQETRRKHRF